jgi:small subunit ribosomal protein S2
MIITDTTGAESSLIQSLFKAGGHLGYSKTRRHPSAKGFIFGSRNNTDIINLEKTESCIEEAKKFLKTLGTENKQVLLVGTKQEIRDIAESAANRMNVPYATERWIGGTLTNFSEIRKRINRLEMLSSQHEKGELLVKTKKEKLMIEREIARLKRFFGGLTTLLKLPSALFVVDPRAEDTAVKEAIKLSIPVLGIANTDCDMHTLNYPIPANDAGMATVRIILDELVRAYAKGVEEAPVKPIEEKKPEEEKL